jgi:class 3 adenylate cyclase/DNA-binding SARP family transcriptional activator/Tfp pilus assembly protein PilF
MPAKVGQAMSSGGNSTDFVPAGAERATLKVILFADLAQYSRLVAANEAATLAYVERCFAIFRAACADFGAEFIKSTGDGVLVIFDSASSAVDYAMTVQQRITALTDRSAAAGQFRIGLHMGEVHRKGGDVYGHPVNLAARVEAHAEPGGVCVTQEVYWAARKASRFAFRFAGRPVLKNMPEPVSLYHVTTADDGEKDADHLHLKIAVVDGLSIRTDHDESVPLRSRKAQAIIGYLALATHYRELRDRLAALIWPDLSLGPARRALANCLQTISNALAADGSDALLKRDDSVALQPSWVAVDIVALFDHLAEGQVDEALLQRGDLPEAVLHGLDDVSSLFHAWLSVTRHRLRERMIERLEAALERYDIAEPGLKRAAAALLMLEPSHERAARLLIRHLAASGNGAAALRVFNRLKRVLRRQFKIAPSVQTLAVVENLAAVPQNPEVRTETSVPPSRPPVIAIGSFQPHSETIAYAAAGFRAEMIANLSRFREWTVVETPETGGGDSDYLLSAEVLAAGDDVQLRLTLAARDSRRVVWSQAFTVSLSNWITVHTEVVGRIASTLEVYLSQDRLSRLTRRPLFDLGAYDAWLRGENLLNLWSPQAEDEAERLFEHAIAQAPDFAPAYASLASVYNSREFIRPGVTTDAATKDRALQLSRRAFELDPLDARNQIVVAWSTAVSGRYEQSVVHFDLAAELNPNSVKTLISAALGMAFMGNLDTAHRLLRRALSLTSMLLDYQWSHVATIRYLTGDLEGAVQAAERSKNVIVDTPGWKAAALRRLGRDSQAEAEIGLLQQAVARDWCGSVPATQQDVINWFLWLFPIRQEEVRKELARQLQGD